MLRVLSSTFLTCSLHRSAVFKFFLRLSPLLTFRSSLRSLSSSNKLDEFAILSEDTDAIQIDGYFPTGFKIRGILIEGGVVCFQDLYLQWKAKTMADVTPESLAFLRLFKPLPDLLVLGCGKTIQPVPSSIQPMLQQLKIRIECIDSVNATSTFNVLNQEGRSVAAALLPLTIEEDS